MNKLKILLYKQKNFRKKFGKNKFNSLNKDIQFENVSFGYNQDKNVINNVNLEIKKNNITAIIGESGSGKSTLADLLVGIIIPNEEKIKINGVNLLDFGNQFLSRKYWLCFTREFFYLMIQLEIISAGFLMTK